MNERWQGILNLLKQQSKFALTSLVATTVDIAIYSLFIYVIFPLNGVEAGSRQMMIATVIGTSVGMIINFFLQKKYVFSLKRKTSAAFSLSILVSLGGILLDMLIVGILSRIPLFGLHPILKLGPKFIAKGLIFFYNFFLKRMVFENRKTTRNWQVPTFFTLFLLLGLFILPDFGMSWDEPAQRLHGMVSWDYVNKQLDLGWERIATHVEMETYKDREYGVLFSMTGYTIECALGLETLREHYMLRHYMTFTLFWVACIFFFRTLRLRFEDWRIALLGVVILIFSPRIFGHAFFNPKDIVLMACCMISTFTLIKMLQHLTWRTALWHALACAVVINTRIVGILIPAFTILFLGMQLLQKLIKREPISWSSSFRKIAAWGGVMVLLTVLFWPFLWPDPLGRFQEAFTEMAKFPWKGGNFFYGMRVKGTEISWYYTPLWIIATTPALWTILGVLGGIFVSFLTIKNVIKERLFYTSKAQLIDLLALGLFIGPLFIVAYKNSVLYNGWRQMYFVFPPFIMLGLSWLWLLWQRAQAVNWKRYILIGMLAVQISATGYFMVKNHPWYPVYFSIFAGDDLTNNFEMDYWGLASKQALEELLQRDNREKIRVAAANYPGEVNIYFLPDDLKKRIKFTSSRKKADYFFGNYYNELEFSRFKKGEFPYIPENEIFYYDINGDKILSMYKIVRQEEESNNKQEKK